MVSSKGLASTSSQLAGTQVSSHHVAFNYSMNVMALLFYIQRFYEHSEPQDLETREQTESLAGGEKIGWESAEGVDVASGRATRYCCKRQTGVSDTA
uniref:Uncharacterized protein n=1 Tax=Peronospora matthiolae TaxID=2874970 RepID=A0AAV1U8I1_9STRA